MSLDRPIKLIVGLGNPGPKYERTRHNAGADFVTELARQSSTDLREESRFFAATGRIIINGRDVRLAIPNTFMNLSGKAVAAIANFYQIPVEEILIAHDELDLNPGVARFKKGGGHGGHNGLRSIIDSLGKQKDFARLRLGIGHPGHASQVTNFVLKKAPASEQQLIDDSIDCAIREIPKAVDGQWQLAMTALHTN